MDDPAPARPVDGDTDLEVVRLQAEEHPLIEDAPPTSTSEHCLRLMHLRAYDEAVRHAAGRDVLDVGCNTGYGTIRFVPVARRVVGVDVSARAIEAARERAVDGRPEFVLGSGIKLPFGDAAFDLVTSFQVLEHVPDAGVFLAELARVTRPGGTVILATPNAATRLYPGMVPWNRFHVREYLAGELRDVLRGTFSNVTVLGMFGAPELYETEIRRVDAARQRIRRKEEAATRKAAAMAAKAARAATPPSAPTNRTSRPLPIRIARAVLPAPVRGWLRTMLGRRSVVGRRAGIGAATLAPSPGATPDTTAVDLESFLRYTVDDLWYSPDGLERAMDLLATCEVPAR